MSAKTAIVMNSDVFAGIGLASIGHAIRLFRIVKTYFRVGAITKRLSTRSPTAAQRDLGLGRDRLSVRVSQIVESGDNIGAIIRTGDCRFAISFVRQFDLPNGPLDTGPEKGRRRLVPTPPQGQDP